MKALTSIFFYNLCLGLCRAVARPVLARLCACKMARPGPGRKSAARRPSGQNGPSKMSKISVFLKSFYWKQYIHSLSHQHGTFNNTVLINICKICHFFGHLLTCIKQKILALFGPGHIFFGPFRPGPIFWKARFGPAWPGPIFRGIFLARPGPGRKIFGPTQAYLHHLTVF